SAGPDDTASTPAPGTKGRWAQLVLWIVCMAVITNLQYSSSLFLRAILTTRGWTTTDVQFSISIFVAVWAFAGPLAGWIVDRIDPRRGPKLMVAFGGAMVAVGWILNSVAGLVGVLFLAAAVTGIGSAAVYATCIGQAAKWFPERRGLAIGLATA